MNALERFALSVALAATQREFHEGCVPSARFFPLLRFLDAARRELRLADYFERNPQVRVVAGTFPARPVSRYAGIRRNAPT